MHYERTSWGGNSYPRTWLEGTCRPTKPIPPIIRLCVKI